MLVDWLDKPSHQPCIDKEANRHKSCTLVASNMLRSLHEPIAAEEDDPPFGTPTNLDDDGLIPHTDINDEDGGGWSNVGRFWLISVAVFAAAAFLLVAFCKRYGADLVDGWVNDRAHGELSEESYLQRVMRRRAESEEAKKECPVKRKARLVKRLEEEGVVMVRCVVNCFVLRSREIGPNESNHCY